LYFVVYKKYNLKIWNLKMNKISELTLKDQAFKARKNAVLDAARF
jgi:hypothetical protein